MLDLIALSAAELPVEQLIGPRNVQFDDSRRRIGRDPREDDSVFRGAWNHLNPAALDDRQLDRLWRMLRFVDEPEGAVDQWAGPKVELHDPSYWGAAETVVDQPFRYRPPWRR